MGNKKCILRKRQELMKKAREALLRKAAMSSQLGIKPEVLRYFEDIQNLITTCKLCGAKITCAPETTGERPMEAHLKENHPDEFNEVSGSNVLSQDNSSEKPADSEKDLDKNDNKRKMSKEGELDKLKRRMIRSIARLMKEKETEEEVWEELRKESGNNCKKLWERMRSLTLKKLKRLQEADDRVDTVPLVARMSLTDWLLYDMVIVHEKVDAAAEEALFASNVLPKLFSLVQMFHIEGLSGSELAEAWTNATLYYNSSGFQCSPMLMQRRWYQLTKSTREKFYQFWFSYRGNKNLLPQASQVGPTKLQQEVALRYPNIIIQPFPDWEDRIEKRLVILPDEFQEKIRDMQGKPIPPKDENVPDLIIMEPKIDTITLADSDSEPESETKNQDAETENLAADKTDSEEPQFPVIVQVKSEPQDEITDVYQTEREKANDFQDEIERLEHEENKIAQEIENISVYKAKDAAKPSKTNVTRDNVKDLDAEPPAILENNVKEKIVQNNLNTVPQDSILIEDDDDQEPKLIEDVEQTVEENIDVQDDISKENDCSSLPNNQNDDYNISSDPSIVQNDAEYNINVGNTIDPTLDAIVNSTSPGLEMLPVISAITCGDEAKIKTEVEIEFENKIPKDRSSDDEDDLIMLKDEVTSAKVEVEIEDKKIEYEEELHNIDKISPDIDLEIEFADDGIEYFEEEEQTCTNDEAEKQEQENIASDKQVTPKFDLKLLMEPVVYTKKLDNMDVYKGRPLFDTIEDKDMLEKISLESKPVSSRSINQVESVADNIKTEPPDDVQNDVQADDLFLGSSESESEELIDESMKVKSSSYLFQKPRHRNYNPIQLCKNPDFNTRLKRLSIGFFGSFRNRAFLKACKPMTIDVSKAFESKLINGTVYLKESNQNVQIPIEKNIDTPISTSSILPSAVAVQSLMPHDTKDVDQILQEELKKRMLERNKVISLPSISVVRQINEQLQQAAVAPIMAPNRVQNRGVVENRPNNFDYIIKSSGNNMLDGKTTNKQPIGSSQKTIPSSVRGKTTAVLPRTSNSNTTRLLKTQPKKCTITEESILPMMREKINKKKSSLNANPSWTTKPTFTNNFFDTDELLLTIDTLYKMLAALDPSCVDKILNHNAFSSKVAHTLPKESKPKANEKPKVQTDLSMQESPRALNRELITCFAPDPLKKKRRCCWSRYKIQRLNGTAKTIIKHKCKPYCKCCCREELRLLEKEMARKPEVNGKETVACSCAIGQKQNKTDVNPPAPVPKIRINIEILPDAKENNIGNDNKSTDVSIGNPDDSSITNENNQACQNLLRSQSPVEVAHFDTLRVYSDSNLSKPKPTGKAVPTNEICTRSILRRNKQVESLPILPVPIAGNCTCAPNVTVDQQQNTLLVDGSNECTVHGRTYVYRSQSNPKEAKIFINSKKLKSCDRPYYLGKNKILLTDVKRPVTPDPVDPTMLEVPSGVQVIVLPDGTITYSQNPDVELTPTQLATMPIILNAIKNHFNGGGITIPQSNVAPPPVSEIIDLGDENVSTATQNVVEGNVNEVPDKTIDCTIGEMIAPTDSISARSLSTEQISGTNEEPMRNEDGATDGGDTIVNRKQDDSRTAVENNSVQTSVDGETISITDNNSDSCKAVDNAKLVDQPPLSTDKSIDTNSACQEKSETADKNVHKPSESLLSKETVGDLESESNTTNAGSRNLLSDLMEMSGILEEDVIPVQEPVSQESTETKSQEALTEAPLIVNLGSPSTTFQIPVPGLTPFSNTQCSIPAPSNPVQELNPVTSFKELKYACEHGGNFFKLDLNSGLIVPINVCIKKTKSSTSLLAKKTNTDFIDLTDEPDVSVNAPIVPLLESQCLDTLIKPQVILKPPLHKRTPILLQPREPARSSVKTMTLNIQKSQEQLSLLLPHNLKPLKMSRAQQLRENFVARKQKRKQSLRDVRFPLKMARNLNKIEAKIDLVDSDAPMEEEYLVDPSSDESSDDEPLAKVAKRMRCDESKDSTNPNDLSSHSKSQNESLNIEVADNEIVEPDNFNVEPEDNDIADVETTPQDANIPRPTQLVVTKMDEPMIINFSLSSPEKDGDEDSQQDCILGV